MDIEATCSMVVNNTLYIIGGPPFNPSQFIQVDGCSLVSLGEIFEHTARDQKRAFLRLNKSEIYR